MSHRRRRRRNRAFVKPQAALQPKAAQAASVSNTVTVPSVTKADTDT